MFSNVISRIRKKRFHFLEINNISEHCFLHASKTFLICLNNKYYKNKWFILLLFIMLLIGIPNTCANNITFSYSFHFIWCNFEGWWKLLQIGLYGREYAGKTLFDLRNIESTAITYHVDELCNKVFEFWRNLRNEWIGISWLR